MLRTVMKLVAGLGSICILSLAGCGAGSPANTTTAVPAGTLNGNWLLTGSHPFINPLYPTGQNFGLSMTFASTGNELVGGGSDQYPCGAFEVGGGGNVVTGTIASDGTFTAQSTVGAPVSSLQLSGKVPAAGASTWSGSYTFNSNSSTCPQALTGAFTAARIADVTGTYATTAPILLNASSAGTAPQTVSVTFTLQQGATLAGATAVDPELLSGSVKLQGTSCVQAGTAPAAAGSGLLGSTFVSSFAMNDGSTMHLLGDIEDTGSSKLALQGLILSGGTCGTMSSGPFEVVRQ